MGRVTTPEAELARWIAHYIEGADNVDMKAYGGGLLNAVRSRTRDAKRFFWFIRYMMRLGQMYRSRVLDVGCGFGWDAVAISILGDNEVVANDIRESMTAPLRERTRALKDKGAPLKIEALTGDICALDIAAGSFDAVYSDEAIEHINDLDAMFAKCAAVLRNGGRCIIADDSNALCSSLRVKNSEMWRKRDHAWEYIRQLKKERPIENRDIEPYALMRERIVQAANPSLAKDDVDAIVNATAGLTEWEIVRIAKEYNTETILPTPPEFSWCRNPVTGEYCERLLDPFEVCDLMKPHGFHARVYHAFRRFPFSLLNGVSFRALNRMLFDRRSLFVIVAEKA